MDVHARCIHILQRTCNPDKPIHFNCFIGDPELFKWMSGATIFLSEFISELSVTMASFSVDQICGIRSVPMNCVFLRPTPHK